MKMDEQNNETIQVETQAKSVEDSINKGVEVQKTSLGKFKDVEALMKAYNNLESEFTKRCQKIKELEGKASADKTESVDLINNEDLSQVQVDNKVQEDENKENKNGIENQIMLDETKLEKISSTVPETPSGEENNLKSITKEEKEKILFEYLTEIIDSKQKAVLLDNKGVGISTPVSKPKSIMEAGMLAKEIF